MTFQDFLKKTPYTAPGRKKCDYSASFRQKSVHVFSKHAFKWTLKSPRPCRISTTKMAQTQLKKCETCTLFCQLPRKFMCWDFSHLSILLKTCTLFCLKLYLISCWKIPRHCSLIYCWKITRHYSFARIFDFLLKNNSSLLFCWK